MQNIFIIVAHYFTDVGSLWQR